MRIAYVGHPNSPNAYYRAIGPALALADRGHEARCVLPEATRFRGDLVRGCDVLLVHRFTDGDVLKAVQYARQAGIAVVWDNDDDMRAIPRGDPMHRLLGGARSVTVNAGVARLARLADVVTTPSGTLAELYRELGAQDVRTIENHVPDESVLHPPSRAGSRRNGDGGDLLVGWIAGTEHRIDVDRLPIGAVLARLLDEQPLLRVTTVGAWLGIRHERYQHVDGVRYLDLAPTIASFDVAIAPIADVALNRARSNVKLKEYAALGVPWLASPIGPYAGLGEHEGGRLVGDDDWHAALERLLTSSRDRRKLAKRALRWGRTQTISANLGRWEDALATAIARARARTVTPRQAADAVGGA